MTKKVTLMTDDSSFVQRFQMLARDEDLVTPRFSIGTQRIEQLDLDTPIDRPDLVLIGLDTGNSSICCNVVNTFLKKFPDTVIMILLSSEITELPTDIRELSVYSYIYLNMPDQIILASVMTALRLNGSFFNAPTNLEGKTGPMEANRSRLLENMDKISRIMQKTDDLELMLEELLDCVINIFECDRANLCYPCDIKSPFFQVVMEKSKPEYPGLKDLKTKLPVTATTIDHIQSTANTDYPVAKGPAVGRDLGVEGLEDDVVGYKSLLVMALRPTIGKNWLFYMHQCSYARNWTEEDKELFYEIGRRLEDALSRLLLVRDLREKEKQLETAQRIARIGSWETDIETNQIKASAEYCRIRGIDPKLLDNPTEWRKIRDATLDPDDNKKMMALVSQAKEKVRGFNTDIRIRSSDGVVKDVNVFVEIAANEHGKPQKIQGTIQDITERKETERTLKKLNRELRALSNCNQALIRADDEPALLKRICDIVVDEAGYRLVWVGMIGERDTKNIKPVAWAGVDNGFIRSIHSSIKETSDQNDPIKDDKWGENTVCIQDLQKYPGPLSWRSLALEQGYRSCIIIPLKNWEHQVFGLISIYSVEVNTFVAEEIRLLEELADDLAYGVSSLRHRIAHQKALKDLRKSNDLFQAVIEAAPVAIVGVDEKGIVNQVWNPTAESVFGWSAEEVMGKITPTVPLDDKAEYERFHKILKASVPFDGIKINRRRRDGTPIDLEVYASPLKDSKGNSTGRISVFLDVTERTRMEQALRESEERYRTMFQNSPLGIFRSTLDGEFIEINPAMISMLGYSPGDPVLADLKTFSGLIYTSSQDQKTIFSESKASLCASQHQLTFRKKEGSEIIVNLYLKTIQDTRDQPSYFEGIVEDITERKHNEELMIQTEKMVSLGGLIAGIAHEINNPLGAMMMGAQNVERRLSTETKSNRIVAREVGLDFEVLREYLVKRDVLKNLSGIRDSGKKAGEIISNMLQFSRKSESRRSYGNLLDIVDKSIDLASKDYDLKKKFDFRKIKITKEYDSQISISEASYIETEIEQVFLNLLRNASQALSAAKTKDPQITIRVTRENQYARIEIEDNGPGVPESVKKHLFEPFFTTKPVGQGTGLGLSVSYMIIAKNHNGTIEVESEINMGTRFIIKIPLKISKQQSSD